MDHTSTDHTADHPAHEVHPVTRRPLIALGVLLGVLGLIFATFVLSDSGVRNQNDRHQRFNC